MHRPYSTAIIGVSGYGKIYLERLLHHADTGDLKIVAATILNQAEEVDTCQRLLSYGCRLYGHFLTMLDAHRGSLDLVLIPTGIPWHTRMTIAALQAGANVLVEKPLAMTVREVQEIQQASERSGRFVAVGFQQMYADVTHQVRDGLESGEIGRLRTVSGLGLWPRPITYFSRNDWSGRMQVGGVAVWDSPLTNGLSHFLMRCLYWSSADADNPWTRVEAELYRSQAIDSYDTAALRLVTKAGMELLFFASHSCRNLLDPVIVLEGSEGRIVWTTESCTLKRFDGGQRRVKVPSESEARRQMFERVIRRLHHPGEPICTPQLAVLHTRCVSAFHQADAIHDIPAASLRREPVLGTRDEQVHIDGIESALFQSFAERRLPDEIGFSWSRPAFVSHESA